MNNCKTPTRQPCASLPIGYLRTNSGSIDFGFYIQRGRQLRSRKILEMWSRTASGDHASIS